MTLTLETIAELRKMGRTNHPHVHRDGHRIIGWVVPLHEKYSGLLGSLPALLDAAEAGLRAEDEVEALADKCQKLNTRVAEVTTDRDRLAEENRRLRAAIKEFLAQLTPGNRDAFAPPVATLSTAMLEQAIGIGGLIE